MSSPRLAPKPLDLCPHSFGDTPAAIYLADLLNKWQDTVLARKVAKTLNNANELVADLVRAHLDYDALPTGSFGTLLQLIAQKHQSTIPERFKHYDPRVANLVLNVILGHIKAWKRRVQRAIDLRRKAIRKAGPGVYVEELPATPFVGETTVGMLHARTQRRQARREARMAAGSNHE